MFLVGFVAAWNNMVHEMFLVFPSLDSQLTGEAVESSKISVLVILVQLTVELMDFLVGDYL